VSEQQLRIELVVRTCDVNDLRPPGPREFTLLVVPLVGAIDGPGPAFALYSSTYVAPGTQLWLVTPEQLRSEADTS
jgi:hypothetical protein